MSTPTCYWQSSSLVASEESGGWFNCPNSNVTIGGAELCCLIGGTCGPDSICHTTGTAIDDDDGWYVGGCTDPSYSDAICRTSCGKLHNTSILSSHELQG